MGRGKPRPFQKTVSPPSLGIYAKEVPMMEILKDIAVVVGLLISLGTILCVTIPGVRKKIIDWAAHAKAKENFDSKMDRVYDAIELIKDSQRSVLRDRITRIYYDNLENKTLHSYEMENLSHLHESYAALEGNTFEATIYHQMTTEWKVIP